MSEPNPLLDLIAKIGEDNARALTNLGLPSRMRRRIEFAVATLHARTLLDKVARPIATKRIKGSHADSQRQAERIVAAALALPPGYTQRQEPRDFGGPVRDDAHIDKGET